MLHSQVLRGFVVVGLLLLSEVIGATCARATVYTWNVNGGNMTVPGNWSPSGLPTAGDTGVIGSGGPIVARLNGALAGPPDALQVLPNGTLELTASVATDQNIVMMGGLFRSSANYNYGGDIFLSSNSTFGTATTIMGLTGLIQNHGANAGKFIKVGSGVVSLATTNSYTGGTEIQTGSLSLSGTDPTGTGDVALVGGVLNHLHVTLNSGRIIANGGTIATVANYNLNARIGLQVDTTFSTPAIASTLSGVIEDEGLTPGKLIKKGSGTYFLSNSANTFSAGTEVQQGTIVGQTANSLGSGGVVVKNGAQVMLFATATQGAGVLLESGATAIVYSSSDTITAQDGSFFRLYQDNRNSQNPVSISGTVTMLTPAQASHTQQFFQGAISGTGKLVYDGTNDTAQNTDLQAVNSYQGGTQVKAGLLRISSNGRLPDVGLVQVDSNAKLLYSGVASDTIGGLGGSGTLELGGAALTMTEGFSPGQSPGTLTIAQTGSLLLSATSVSEFELGALAGPNDQVLFTGAANLALGGTLSIANLPGIEVGDYTLFDLNGGTVTGSFTDVLFEGPVVGFVSITAGNDVVLTITSVTPAPEPTSLVLFALGFAGLQLKTRRRARA